jgi:hypothetical protein
MGTGARESVLGEGGESKAAAAAVWDWQSGSDVGGG